ncbi:MAG: tetratricopeptide repeat protein [Vulcanimicrobiaceae bacterium]
MAPTSPRRVLEAKLKEIDARLRRLPGNTELTFERARLLDKLERTEAAQKAYLEVLRRSPLHFGAINDLGMLLYRSGRRGDALKLYAEAVDRHGDNPVAHANLAFMFLRGQEPEQAREHYETALRLDPSNTEAQRGLMAVLTQLGEAAAVTELHEAGAGPSMTVLPYRGARRPVSLLLLVSAGAGNVATERLIDDRVFETTKLVVEYYDPAQPLPKHHVVFNAIGDAESCAAALAAARGILAKSAAPLVNAPERIALTGRAANAERLGALAGVVTAHTSMLRCADLRGAAGAALLAERGHSFPMLLRSPGFHTGRHFVRVENERDLAAAASDLPGEALLAIEFLDTRNADGLYRKYRVMTVGGALYPLHMAISPNWKVHYFSADMAENPAHRAEDAAFLRDMPAALGPRAVAALESVQDTLSLDYGGIDFSIDAFGNVVVFEANATMVLVPAQDDERWSYRRGPTDRVFAAVCAMLRDKSFHASGRKS